MKKKRILGIVVAAVIGVSSIVPAFADTTSTQDQTTSTKQIETKQLSEQEKLAKLTKKAAKTTNVAQ